MNLNVDEARFNLSSNNDATITVTARKQYYTVQTVNRLLEANPQDFIPNEFLDLVKKSLEKIHMVSCVQMPITDSKCGSIFISAQKRCATKQEIYAFCAEVNANWAKVIEVTKKVFYDTDDHNHSWTFKLSF